MTPPNRHGGPRPGFGGKQPGAGRKAQPVTDQPVTVAVVLAPDLARAFDELRGGTDRAAWIRQAIEAALKGP